MRFSIRDALWATTTVALITAWLIASARQALYVQALEQRLQAADKRAVQSQQVAQQQRSMAGQIVEQANQARRLQHQEILSLRQLLKQSVKDQRDWFELEVDQNRLIAVAPATIDSGDVTPHTVRQVESATGLDGKRLRHFLTPIQQLRPPSNSIPSE